MILETIPAHSLSSPSGENSRKMYTRTTLFIFGKKNNLLSDVRFGFRKISVPNKPYGISL